MLKTDYGLLFLVPLLIPFLHFELQLQVEGEVGTSQEAVVEEATTVEEAVDNQLRGGEAVEDVADFFDVYEGGEDAGGEEEEEGEGDEEGLEETTDEPAAAAPEVVLIESDDEEEEEEYDEGESMCKQFVSLW